MTASLSLLEETLINETIICQSSPIERVCKSNVLFTLEALNINVKLLSITNSIGTPVDTSSITSVPGTYTAKYEVSYTHNNKIRTHTYSQKITVNKKEVINNEVVNNEETSD